MSKQFYVYTYHPCINRVYKSRVTCSLPILLGKGEARHLKSSILFTGLFFSQYFLILNIYYKD